MIPAARPPAATAPGGKPRLLASFALEQQIALAPSLDRCDLRFGSPEKTVGEHDGVVVIVELGTGRKRDAAVWGQEMKAISLQKCTTPSL